MIRKHTPLLFLVLLLLPIIGCEPESDAPEPEAQDEAGVSLTEVWRVETGLLKPESVVYDEARDVLYLSNINGEPAEKDGNGYLSRISPDGEVLDEQWVANLHAPKGITLHDDRLYVADVDALLDIDPETGEIQQRHVVEGDVYLNDVTVHPNGTVYVSDSRYSKIYVLSEGELEIWLEDDRIQMPNGVHIVGEELFVAAGDSTTDNPGGARYLQAVSLADQEVRALRGQEPEGALDTIEPDGQGGLFVTDWGSGRLMHFDHERGFTLLQQLGQGAADVDYVAEGGMLYVPVMMEGALIAYDVEYDSTP